jgi:hypothetical protein
VNAVEYDDFTFVTYLRVLPPQEVAVEFLGSWDPEVPDSHTMWIDSLEDASDGAVLAASIESLLSRSATGRSFSSLGVIASRLAPPAISPSYENQLPGSCQSIDSSYSHFGFIR